MDIRQALATACATLGLDRLDAQLLLLHALGRPQDDRAWLLAHDTDALAPEAEARYIDFTRRRASGVPLAYVTGVREFYGLKLQVDARVLDPRPDTETLVDWALDCLRKQASPTVVDLGTGSGAIALAIKAQRPDARVIAVDASTEALTVAQANAHQLGLAVQFLQGNWLEPLRECVYGSSPHERAHLIVSNPPYIAEGDPHLMRLGHEPQQALTSGPDGLDAVRSIITQAPTHLLPGGWLLLEHGWDQAAAVRSLLLQGGAQQVHSRLDLADIERCSGGVF